MTNKPSFISTPLPLNSSRHVTRSIIRVCHQQPPKNSNAHSTAPDISRRHLLTISATLASLSLLPGRASALSKKRILAKAGPEVELPSGVTYRDITVGKGYSPQNGDSVAIHFSLFYDNLEVESSRESQGLAASPIGFTYGAMSGPGSIMRGVIVGIEGMKVGGLRLITVPPELAYGEKGKPPLIPPNATIDLAISLLSCKRSGTNPIVIINPKAQIY